MADRGDTHYSVSKLNSWFLWSSVLLLVSTVWMVIDDWNAPWKKYQAEFRKIEEVRTRAAIESEEMQAQASASAAVEESIVQAEGRLRAQQDEISAVEAELRVAKGEHFSVSETTKKAKQELAWEKYWIEEHRNHEDDMEYGAEKLAEYTQAYSRLEAETEIKLAVVDELQGRLDGLNAEVKGLETDYKKARTDLDLLENKLDRLAPESGAAKLANIIRDFPGLDFVDPKNKVKKQVLGDLTFELNFTKGARIDMCQTCHEGSDREGFTRDLVVDGEPIDHPYLTHPRLDLYLTAKSPHPVTEVGCTICHRGSGQALDFIRADHVATGSEQMAEWIEKYHWHKQHHWDYPMLRGDFIEASCVQCHKESMELIADDAPRVSDGYRLFEDKGCYACHKVEWFPTKRRPGPSLVSLQEKLEQTWAESWVANPTDFRPDTRMPRIYHLSNYEPEEEVIQSEWGEGRKMMGQEWNETAVASVTAYLFANAQEKAMDPIPVQGDADRGRETFRVVGCLSCHNMAPYPGQDLKTFDLAFERNGENQHGPNLRGVATKLDRTWLYNWIKDPKAYWEETQMPNLRLSDQEAADITSYIMDDPDGIFTDVPAVWEPERNSADMDVLREMARWFFSREGRTELRRRFAGENPAYRWDREEDLLLAVGEKQIAHQGCFSCHEIDGFQGANPIGVELTTWGSKTVDKLSWDFRAKILAHERGWSLMEREEHKYYRENWLYEKLSNPRIFDEQKVRNPIERARMPNFGLTDDEILSLSNFVVGLVDDEVQLAEMKETPAQAAMDTGMRVVRQHNCMACHVVEPAQITFLDEDGFEHTVAAEPMSYTDSQIPEPLTSLEGLLAGIAAYEEMSGEEVEDVGFRLLEVSPEFGVPGESVFVIPDQLVDVTPAKGGDFVRTVASYYLEGIEMHDSSAPAGEQLYAWNYGENGAVMDVDGKLRSYIDEAFDKIRWVFAPPVLLNEGGKLQPDWFYSFLLDPGTIRQQMRVRMPTFNITPEEAGAVVDYFAYKAEKEYAPHYARALRSAMGTTPNRSVRDRGLLWPELTNSPSDREVVSAEEAADLMGITAAQVRAIEAGAAPDIAANFAKVKAYGDEIGFQKSAQVNPAHEVIPQHSTSYEPEIEDGRRVGLKGVKCMECHFLNGNPSSQSDAPITWAPDLGMTRERLRPDWTREWIWNPPLKYPGTPMAVNFGSVEPLYQDIYPGSTNAQQIEAVLDWLYNIDSGETPVQ